MLPLAGDPEQDRHRAEYCSRASNWPEAAARPLGLEVVRPEPVHQVPFSGTVSPVNGAGLPVRAANRSMKS